MDTGSLTRGMGKVARLLIAASLFLVLIWWLISLWLFAAGALLLGAVWLLEGADDSAPSLQSMFTVPE